VLIPAMAHRYIVSLFKDAADVQAEAEAVMRGRGGVIHQYFKSGFKGFAATIPAAELDGVRKNAKVLSVESFPMLRPAEAGSPAHQTRWGVDSKTLIGSGLEATAGSKTSVAAPLSVPAQSSAPKVPAQEVKAAPQEIASFRFLPAKPIADRYIVTLSKDVADTQTES